MKELVIVRGLPGTGKSTYARSLIKDGFNHFEADMYFEIDGKYKFEPAKIKNAHNWCQRSTEYIMQNEGKVVVSNTFTQKWEVEPYLELAKKYGYKVSIKSLTKMYSNIHNVPDNILEAMKERYEEII